LREVVNRRTDNTFQKKKNKKHTMIHKTLYRKLNIDQHKPHKKKLGVNSGVPEG